MDYRHNDGIGDGRSGSFRRNPQRGGHLLAQWNAVWGRDGHRQRGVWTIDPATGFFTVLNGSIPVQALAAIPSLSEFYDVGSSVAEVDIITPTGSIAQHFNPVGGNDTSDFVHDLAYDSLNGVLYASDGLGNLDTIDLTTGAGTAVGHLIGTGGRANGPIAFDWNTNTLYMLVRDPVTGSDGLYSVDTDTGAATLIGPTGVSNVDFTGFADLPVPGTVERGSDRDRAGCVRAG